LRRGQVSMFHHVACPRGGYDERSGPVSTPPPRRGAGWSGAVPDMPHSEFYFRVTFKPLMLL